MEEGEGVKRRRKNRVATIKNMRKRRGREERRISDEEE